MRQRAIQMIHDRDAYCVRVPLGPTNEAAKTWCEIDPASWEKLLKKGFTGNMNYIENRGKKYVTACAPRTLYGPDSGPVMVAREITGAKAGQVVAYQDGNPLNLRLSNLKVVDTKAAERMRNTFQEVIAQDKSERESLWKTQNVFDLKRYSNVT